MMWNKFRQIISSFEGPFYKVLVWAICGAFFFLGAALSLRIINIMDNFFEFLLGFAIFLIFIIVGYPLSMLIVGELMEVVDIIKSKSGNQKAIWTKGSKLIFAGKVYSSFDALMHNYFNRKHSVSEIGKEFKYGIEFMDKYRRKLYVYVDSAPCFDAEDYLTTPKYYYVFFKKRSRIYALYTDSSSDFCLTDSQVKKLPDCEYTSKSLYEMMKHDGFINGNELKDE